MEKIIGTVPGKCRKKREKARLTLNNNPEISWHMKKSRRTYNGVHLNKKSNTQDVVEQSLTKYTTMTNDENTYIGMSLPEGIRYITVFEKGDFENCGRILRTFYRTEDRVRKLLALGNLLHLGGSLSSNENKTSCWPLNNGNPIHEAKEISGKEKFFLLGDWTYLYENGRWFLGYEGKIYEISNPEFSVFVPDKDHTPSPLDKGLYFAVISETGKLEFTPEIVNGWDTWKSLPKRVSEKGKTVYIFRKTQLIKVIKPKKLES